MTAAAVQAVARGNNATNSTSHSVVMPATVNAGDLLIIFFASDGGPTHARSGALALSFNLVQLEGSAFAANGTTVKMTVWWKRADGTEGGQTATFTTSASEMSAWHVYRISGAHALMPPMACEPVNATSAAPNPAAVAAPWGSADNLWLIAFAGDANTADGGSFAHPTNYTSNGIYDEADNTAGVGIGSSYRANTAASEDAGAWTINASEQWAAVALVIAPADAPTTPCRRSLASAASATVTKPTDTASGDVMLAFISNFTNNTIPSAPAGWSTITSGQHSSVSVGFAVFGKVAGGSEGANYNFTNATEGTIITFFGETVDDADPFGPGSTNSGNSTTITGTGITTEAANALLLMYNTHSGTPSAGPSGMNNVSGFPTDSSGYEERIATAGATGNRTATIASTPWHSQMVALNPTPPAAGGGQSFRAQFIG